MRGEETRRYEIRLMVRDRYWSFYEYCMVIVRRWLDDKSAKVVLETAFYRLFWYCILTTSPTLAVSHGSHNFCQTTRFFFLSMSIQICNYRSFFFFFFLFCVVRGTCTGVRFDCVELLVNQTRRSSCERFHVDLRPPRPIFLPCWVSR